MAKDFGSSEGWVNAEEIFLRGNQTAEHEYKHFENAFLCLFQFLLLTSESRRCWSNSGSDQVSIGTYDRKSYMQSKAYMPHPRISLIMSVLVHALNLRSSADFLVDFSPSGKCQLSETSQRRWLECNLTRDHFRTP